MGTKPKIESFEQTTKTLQGGRRRFDDRISASAIIEVITNAIILIDLEGTIAFVNQETLDLFSYERDELLGQDIEMLIPGRFQHKHVNHRKNYYVKPSVRQMGIGLDLFARRKDGTEFPCEVSLSPLKTADGDYVICGLHDISIRKHTENALLESERKLNEQYTEMDIIYSTSPMGMCLMDTDLRYLRCNEKLAEINGISVVDHIGRTLREIVPEIAETMEPVYRRVIDTGEPVIDVEASMIAGTDSQKKRYFSACYYPVKSEDGVVRGVSSIVQEITERVEAEKLLRDAHDQLEKRVLERTKELKGTNLKLRLEHDTLLKSEHRLRQLVESTNAIPWEANAKTWQFTYVGPQAVKLLGYPVKQWYEKDFWADHIHPEDKDYTIKYCRDSSQHLNNYEFDYRMIKANGGVIWLHDIVKVGRKNGKSETLWGFMIDITDRKKVEEEMHMAEEEANMHRERLAHLVRVQALGEMASGIAHEINQPLAAIDSYAQASRKHLQSGKANIGKVKELIEKISGQARRAGSVVSHLRAMMQNKTSNPVALDINNLLGEAAEIAGIEAKNNDCNLIFKYCRSLPRVICDEIQIQQVALNLISNAVEAMDDLADDVEKNINVETRIKDDNYVEVCISDNGSGINVRDMNNIFEALYTTKVSGLGMGLSICKSIIENHGGELGYSQNKTGGSRFYFSLPVEK